MNELTHTPKRMIFFWIAVVLTGFLIACGMPKGVTTIIVLGTVVIAAALGVDDASF